MKLAVIGSGPLAIEASLHFHALGAEVKVFAGDESWGGNLKKASNFIDLLDYNWSKLPSDQGLSLANTQVTDGNSYLNYLELVGDKLASMGLVKRARVKRVHKRFLSPSQEVPGSSRLADLFRVVYTLDSLKNTQELNSENKEVFEKLGKEVIDSLKDSVESFEDFDLVIDAGGSLSEQLPMGAGQDYALNELTIGLNENVIYGKDVLTRLDKIKEAKRVTIVGDSEFSLFTFDQIKNNFLENKRQEISFVTKNLTPFENISSPALKKLIRSFQEFLKESEQEYQKDIEEFEKKILHWKSLESHIKAKTPKPAEPKRRFMIYNGAIVSAVDKLLDREGLFVTIEGHKLLGTGEQLKVLGSDIIVVDNGHRQESEISKSLNKDEIGFFKLRAIDLFDGLSRLKTIEKEIMNYFSKA